MAFITAESSPYAGDAVLNARIATSSTRETKAVTQSTQGSLTSAVSVLAESTSTRSTSTPFI